MFPFTIKGQITTTIGIENDSVLKPIYTKLAALQKGDSTLLNIVHIGDSHIQADFLTAVLRNSFQLDFGNAGRGLVFPYRVAGSNGPSDYVSSGTGIWQSRRAIISYPALSIGIMGFGLQSNTPSSITIDTRNQLSTQLVLFSNNDAGPRSVKLLVNDSEIIGALKCSDNDISRFDPARPFSRFTFQFTDEDARHSINFFGTYLTNGHKGVIYNTIGVNGIDYLHYNINQSFFRQLSYLNPDLIIVSLGTNDAFAGDFNTEDFNMQVSTFFELIHLYMPAANILIIAPGDHLLYRRGGNPRVAVAGEILKQYALNNGCAFWDFYAAMGGLGSMRQLIRKGMGQYDGIHLTRAGYEWQAQLFYGAFKNSYTKFTAH